MLKFFKVSRKGISGIVAISIFIVISVISVIGFQNWFVSYGQGIFVDTEKRDNLGAYGTKVVSVSESYIYLKNSYDDLRIEEIKISNIDCDNYSYSYSTNSVVKVDIQDCLYNASIDYGKVVIVTDDAILTNEHSFKNYDPYPEKKFIWSSTYINFSFTEGFGYEDCANYLGSDGGPIHTSGDVCLTPDTKCEYESKGQHTLYGCEERTLDWNYSTDISAYQNTSFGVGNCTGGSGGACSGPGASCEAYSIKTENYNLYECEASYN